ncbi:MAG: GNAT family N-acetyltransferase [Acidobacteriota bacterium]|nr:MAG: GNAT family N-acetyltransferase [Acidobacteriota bacterium]
MQRPNRNWETRRLSARPPSDLDARIIFEEYASDPKVTEFMTWRPHKSVKDTLEYIRRCERVWAESTAFPWSLWLKEEGEFAGFIEIRVGATAVDVGYALARQFWRQGLMTEALSTVIEWSFSNPEIYRVWATCDTENLGSARVLEKVGMEREGVLRRWLVHPNLSDEPRDAYCYSIVR